MRSFLFQALATAAALVAAAPALAQSDVRTTTVGHADLNLASAEGRATLDRRVNGAINRVCGVGKHRDLALVMVERRCVAETRARARVDMASLERRAGETLARNAAGAEVAAR